MKKLFFVIVVLLIGSFILEGEAAKILAIAPTASKSHFILQLPLYKELAASGHEITVLSPYPQKNTIPNYKDVELTEITEFFEAEVAKVQAYKGTNLFIIQGIIVEMGVRANNAILSDPGFKSLIASNATFDVILLEAFLDDSLLALGHYYNAPIIAISTMGATKWISDYVANPNPPSYIPHFFMPASHQMGFVERLINILLEAYEIYLMEYFYHPRVEEFYNKVFPEPKPTYQEARNNAVHLALINMHFTLSHSRPYVSNMIEVGGMHVNRVEEPLPRDIQTFIDSAENGVIYFSLGSNVVPSKLEPQKRSAIIKSLLKRKEHIIWKWDGELPEIVGKTNFFISKWLPQDDILRHPKVKLFVTHGGLLSTTETIYHGVPIVGIPVFGDQTLNMVKAVQAGYAIMCTFLDLSEECLTNALEEVLGNKIYTDTIGELSKRFKDRPMHPLDTAKYWVEYVIRHKGAEHMKSTAMDLSFVQLFSIDTIGVIFLFIILFIFITIYAVKKIYQLLFGAAKSKKIKIKDN